MYIGFVSIDQTCVKRAVLKYTWERLGPWWYVPWKQGHFIWLKLICWKVKPLWSLVSSCSLDISLWDCPVMLSHVNFENLVCFATAYCHTAKAVDLWFLKCLGRHSECVRWHVWILSLMCFQPACCESTAPVPYVTVESSACRRTPCGAELLGMESSSGSSLCLSRNAHVWCSGGGKVIRADHTLSLEQSKMEIVFI